MTKKTKIDIELTNETDEVLVSTLNEQILKAINTVLEHEDIEVDGEISILFVDNERIKALNSEFRNKNIETDVLSFPQYDSIKDKGIEEPYIYLGDIVISLEKAREQAENFGHTFEREILYLVVHSVLHLLGYDHMEEEEKDEMRAREKEIFRKIAVFKS